MFPFLQITTLDRKMVLNKARTLRAEPNKQTNKQTWANTNDRSSVRTHYPRV